MKTLTTLGILIFVLALPVQAMAATLSISPASGTFNRGCNFILDINLNTAGAETDGTDAILLYDNSRFTAISITPGTVYSDFPGNNVDDTSGKVTVSGLASVSSAFSGQGKLATINFQVKENAPAGAAQIKFDFDANDMAKTTDSNVVERSTVSDVLSSVVNGSYTIGTGSCASPEQGGLKEGSTPSAQLKQYKTIDQAVGGKSGGNAELTLALTIAGSVLTILGILGLALL